MTVFARSSARALGAGPRRPASRIAPGLFSVAVLLTMSCTLDTPGEREAAAGGDPERGGRLIATYGCDACHVIPGVAEATGLVGPPLTAWSERSYIAGALPNTPQDLVTWIRDPQGVEPGTAMPSLGVGEADARDIAAYLFTLGTAEPVGRQQPRRPRALLGWFGLRPGGDPDPHRESAGPDDAREVGTPDAREAGNALGQADPALGRAALRRYGCVACHAIPGLRGADAAVGPPLLSWPRRGFIAGSLVNTPENLVRWILDPQGVEPGTVMPDVGATEADARHMAAYLFSLR